MIALGGSFWRALVIGVLIALPFWAFVIWMMFYD